MRHVASPEPAAHTSPHVGGASPGTAPAGREDPMRTHCTVRPALRAAGVALALLLLGLWGLGRPEGAQGASSYKRLNAFPLPAGQLAVTPSGLLQAPSGNFYGTTYYGGAAEMGSVFQLNPGGTLTTRYAFTAEAGVNPAAGLVQDGEGNLYGTTQKGGPDDLGTVFKLTPTGTTFTLTTLHAFTEAGADGQYPQAGLLREADGTLYGTTAVGGAGAGTVFRLTPTGSPDTYTFSTLHTFSGPDGANPQSALVRESGGTLYGTTSNGGPDDLGTVFKLTPTGGTFTLTTLHAFTVAAADGAYPQGTLVQGPDGTLYGTTYGGGPADRGTVFQLALTPTPTLTTLHAFTGSDGAYPQAGLVRRSDGALYGTTCGTGCPPGTAGGATYGTLFELVPTPTPGFTTLYTFTGGADGANPLAGLTRGTNGYFYGTTAQGGGAGKSGVAFVLRVGNTLTLTPAGTGTGTVTSTPAGISCGSTCTEVFLPTATVTLTATAATGSTFTGWGVTPTDIECPGTGPCAVPLGVARTVTATFTLQTFALTIQKGGAGTGTVTSTPAGISCGSTCSGPFDYNTPVTLTATPTSPALFTGWSGAGCSGTGTCVVTMTAVQTVTATFSGPTVPLTVAVGGSSGGSVTSLAPAITCPASCTVAVAGGATVSLTATAGAGGTFQGWTGACTGTGACLVTMSGAKTVTAVFAKTFTDTLTAGSTPIRAVHLTDLRAAIEALRVHYGGGTVTWTDPLLAPGTTPVKRQHLLDLRTGLDGAYAAAGKTHAAYAEAVTTGTLIKASHLSELRGFVKTLVCLVNGICAP